MSSVTWCLLSCLLVHVVLSSEVKMPPMIIKGPISEKIFRSEENIKLHCLAVGYPTPEYTWLKNGVPLEPKQNILYEADGILISDLSAFDEGYYNCHAENQFGVSVSNTSILRRAVIGSYTTTSVKEEFDLEEGKPFVLRYQPIKCYPPPKFTWSTASNPTDMSPQTLITSKRVQIDDEGNLHFAYLLTGDDLAGKIYKCNVNNPFLDNTVGGSYTKLHITAKGGPKNFLPVRSFASASPVIAVVGREISLRCFFAGYPEPVLAWSKPGGRMPMGRYDQLRFNTEFKITNVQQSDEGEYLCRASNVAGVADEIIQIDVQSAPTYLRPVDRPTSSNVTEGDDITFTCNATAEPVAKVAWFINGRPINNANIPTRMRLSNDGMRLTISRVCKTCPFDVDQRATDLMVVQCNASNVHGYVFSDSYLNVLDKTTITDRPTDANLEYDKTGAEFHCAARGDPATPVELSWYRVFDDGRTPVLQRNTTRTIISADRSLMSFNVPEDSLELWRQFRGKYECRATNGYSTDSAAFSLNVDDPPPPPVIDEETTHELTTAMPNVAPLAGASFADMWWILVIAAILLLIIILIIICCLCCKSKGDTYFVDKKEKADHKNPEKELQDIQLQPYHRQDNDPLKGSRPSIGSAEHSGSDDDDMDEYADIDAGKFTEDGSFIGDYAPDQRQSGRKTDSYA